MANAIDDVNGRAADASVAEFVALEKAAWTAVQSAAEWDDRTSPDGYEDYLFFKPHELHQILVSFFETVAVSPAPSQHTGWSDETVEAACAKYAWARYGDTVVWPRDFSPKEISEGRENMRAALTAASSIAPATGFSVLPLKWVDMGEGPRCITVCGMYAISPSSGAYGKPTLTLTGMPGDLFGKFDTLDQAKARAQADFDQRIRSSISPSVAKESGEP